MLCDDLEEWDGGGIGRRSAKEGNICVHRADSLHCTAEARATL